MCSSDSATSDSATPCANIGDQISIFDINAEGGSTGVRGHSIWQQLEPTKNRTTSTHGVKQSAPPTQWTKHIQHDPLYLVDHAVYVLSIGAEL